VTLPLDGLRVLELGSMAGAPFAGKLLAEMGADVVKVEQPGVGDPARAFGPFPGHRPDNEASGLFLYLNTGKRSLTLDVSTVEGRRLLELLLARSDVLLHDLLMSEAQEMGLDPDALPRRHPRLIPAAVTPFGLEGPYADFVGTELTTQAMSGYMGLTGNSDEQPLMAFGYQAEYYAGLTAFVTVLAALEGREAAGFSDYADISWQDGMATLMEGNTARFSVNGEDMHRSGNRIEGIGPFIDVWPTTDGHVAITATTVPQWEGLAIAAGHPEWRDDPANETWELRAANPEVDEGVRSWFAGVSTQEAMEVLQALRVPSAQVMTCADLLADPQVAARGLFVEIDHPKTGPLPYPHRALHITDPDGSVETLAIRAPLLGEHTVEVLGEIDVPSGDLEHLRALGVI
jgi:crotonobetainyl-CoA:carnitine CoA-transferase CaiB-like acyl-CoA transferase